MYECAQEIVSLDKFINIFSIKRVNIFVGKKYQSVAYSVNWKNLPHNIYVICEYGSVRYSEEALIIYFHLADCTPTTKEKAIFKERWHACNM
ncbi:hypothetical protein POVWA2_020240 [Plasmodium ovale wallikeri]|uniref:Uncharacterized protein n=1 Tax=Plasmodium ovale wallikeri TaxID=864142 RepID=A0A1A8YSB3_PLAOA|nr:hypothetical protein POVWA1_020050 [Plasmodium ovale wallikeri]SBT34535.1 hypothetical protein POVWA2_020240 [Plasmodium ovale wallikeri]